MSEPLEYTALLDQTEKDDQVYTNVGYGSRGDSASICQTADYSLTLDELLYRIQYAFLNKGYDVEADVRQVLQDCDESDIDTLLQGLNSYPLTIQQKLAVSRLLHKEGNLKIRYKRGKDQNVYKRKDADKVFTVVTLWEDTIKKISAYFGSNVASYFQFVRTLLYINILMMLLLVGFIIVPELIEGNFQTNVTYGGHFGELSNSFMFYGLYTEDLGLTYNLPLAYFLTWLAANLVCFIYIITIMIVRYHRSKLSDDRGNEYKFAWRTFCSWDYSVTSRQGVMDYRTSLRTDIKEMVREEKSTAKVDSCTKFTNYMGRILSNVIVLGLLVGSGFLIYEVAENRDLLKDLPEPLDDYVRKYQLTAVVAGLKFLVPPIFEQLVRLEGWHPRIETKLTLARTTVFYIASLMIFVTSLYEVTDDCSANSTMVADMTHNESCCWENEVGEEVFKVILVDLGILFAVGILFHLHRALWVKCTCKMIGYSKFDVVSSVLDVVYGQCLVWLGLYFSPVLAAVSVVKLLIVFYFRYFIAKVAMVPPQQLFRASSTGNFYLAILLMNLFISLFPMAYGVIEFIPSVDCGPFSGYDRPYRVISELVGELPNWLEDALTYLGTPAVFVPVLILMIMLVVYFKVKSSSYKRLIMELRRQLKFERKVEKRKIFATGRAMSGGALSRYTSQESLVTPGTRHRKLSQQTETTIIEEEQDF
ncbi:transmembrane channel-like protein 3 [Mercenaria mercenaria]|uniref:transmembrane channel-like protein 3 n=1 Tax=Mercenaria mercenaria TaxID=6596 RepID=UPI00234E5478|nr:transmembrane channel-like protein 3 [Mercenaria mercenaria]